MDARIWGRERERERVRRENHRWFFVFSAVYVTTSRKASCALEHNRADHPISEQYHRSRSDRTARSEQRLRDAWTSTNDHIRSTSTRSTATVFISFLPSSLFALFFFFCITSVSGCASRVRRFFEGADIQCLCLSNVRLQFSFISRSRTSYMSDHHLVCNNIRAILRWPNLLCDVRYSQFPRFRLVCMWIQFIFIVLPLSLSNGKWYKISSSKLVSQPSQNQIVTKNMCPLNHSNSTHEYINVQEYVVLFYI